MDRSTRRRALQAATLALVTAPLAGIGVRALTGDLGANPIEELTHATGEWSLRFLLLALAVTPLRRWLGWSWLAPLRRTLGLAAFAWVCLHLSVWTVLDQFFDWEAMLEDVLDRRYITMGFLGFLCLLPLAVTSTRGWMRRLGPRWNVLHRLAYAAGVCGVVHYLWLAKADLAAPLAHAGVLAVLLGSRLLGRQRALSRQPEPAPRSEPRGSGRARGGWRRPRPSP